MLNQLRDASDSHRSLTIVVAMAITTILMYVLPGLPPLSVVQGSNIWYDSFANAGVFVLLAMGLNVVIGMAGLLDLGYAAFFAIGAYAYAYSNSPFSHTDLPFIPMLFVGAAVAGIFGILLGAPTLRLRGDYLAIMTLGFGEIVPIVFLNLDRFTQGTNGIGGIYRPEPLPGLGAFSPSSPFNYFIVMVVIVTITMILLYRLQDSRIGRAWNAIREDELAAAANGINTVTTKLLALINGIIETLGIPAFDLGPVHVNLARVPFTDYQYLLYGVALVLMMLLRPEGLFPNQRRRQELHIAEEFDEGEQGEITGAMGATPGAGAGGTP